MKNFWRKIEISARIRNIFKMNAHERMGLRFRQARTATLHKARAKVDKKGGDLTPGRTPARRLKYLYEIFFGEFFQAPKLVFIYFKNFFEL